MKKAVAQPDDADEYLQVQIPALTKRELAMRAAKEREPMRVVVLRALKAYGLPVPVERLADRRVGRPK